VNLNSKVLFLEQEILGLGGLPRWAIDTAELWLRPKYNTDALERVLRIASTEKPHPLSAAKDVDSFAADLLKKFGTRESYESWMSMKMDAGILRLERILDNLKAEVEANRCV
jgi:hypothetical protein